MPLCKGRHRPQGVPPAKFFFCCTGGYEIDSCFRGLEMASRVMGNGMEQTRMRDCFTCQGGLEMASRRNFRHNREVAESKI